MLAKFRRQSPKRRVWGFFVRGSLSAEQRKRNTGAQSYASLPTGALIRRSNHLAGERFI